MHFNLKKTATQFAVEQKHGGRISFIFALILTFILSTAAQAAPGDLDTSFGNGGKVITSGDVAARDVAIQPDGKIVVVGTNYGQSNFILARYNTDGSLDASFGVGGKVVTSFGTPGATALAVVIQADGKIVAAGGITPSSSNSVAALARYNQDGSLDASFDGDGKVITAFSSGSGFFDAVVIQADGKIVAAGQSGVPPVPRDFALARYNADGSLDTGFGTGGIVFTDIGGLADVARAVVIQTDGKIIAAGNANPSGGTNYDFALARYNANGSLDTSFGTGGIIVTPFSTSIDEAWAAAIQADGKIVLAGYARVGPGGATDFALARYNSDGTLDSSFGTGGKVTTPIGSDSDFAKAVAIQFNGKIVAAGYASIAGGGSPDFALARYNTDGSLDNSFGTGGKVLTPLTTSDFANGIAIQTDGKIIAAGLTYTTSADFSIALVRYHGDLQARRTLFDFDGDGKSDVSVYRPSAGGWYILNSANNSFSGTQFGISTDKLAPADFDGDDRTDISVFRDGYWYRLNSSNGAFSAVYFGQAGDAAVPADYDGDGKADQAVFRQGNWYILGSQVGFYSVAFGISTDKAVPADFDGDGKTDPAVFRDGFWYILGSQVGFYAVQFGQAGDKPVQADYDGDSKADPAVYRNGNWYILGSQAGFSGVAFGNATDVPAPADFDGDSKADPAVFRDGIWYLLRSTQGFTAVQFGASADKPVPNAFVP